MKTLKDLESFRLEKGQMNAVTGGYNCYIVWADDWSTDQIVVNEPGNESDALKAEDKLQESYGDTGYVICN